MKNSKKLRLLLTNVFLVIIMVFGMSLTVHAARTIPSKVRGYTDSINNIYLTLNAGEYIKITSAKNLKYKITNESWSTNSQNTTSSAQITYYTANAGNYTIKFSIYNASTNKKLANKSITAYVRSDRPVKQYLINGKTSVYSYLTTAKTVTFKVTMNTGYKLKKLEIGTYGSPVTTTQTGYATVKNTESKMTYKTFKNGGKITLGTKGYVYIYSYDYPGDEYNPAWKNYNRHESAIAETSIRITYIDKYTKLEDTTYYYFSRFI